MGASKMVKPKPIRDQIGILHQTNVNIVGKASTYGIHSKAQYSKWDDPLGARLAKSESPGRSGSK